MKDKVNAIIKGDMKSKRSYYISPLCIKITVIILILLLVLVMECIFE